MARGVQSTSGRTRKTLSFYPGPSKVEPEVPRYVIEAHQKGILSANHRSPAFESLYQEVCGLLQKRLRVPQDYGILFTSSATECWEIIAQSLVAEGAFHLYNGAFGAKWFEYSRRLHKGISGQAFDVQEQAPVETLRLPKDTSLIALTHNETRNGTQWSKRDLVAIRERFPEQLIAVDATSSMAGVRLPFEAADVWYASVQKCFGLPAGLGVMLLSPAAMEAARVKGEKQHYNSLTYLLYQMENNQTGHTPNVLGIWLLAKVLKKRRGMKATDRIVRRHRQNWREFLKTLPHVKELVSDPTVASDTVITLELDADLVTMLLQEAQSAGFVLGKGYGAWQANTIRIANFPQHTQTDIQRLQEFLQAWFSQR